MRSQLSRTRGTFVPAPDPRPARATLRERLHSRLIQLVLWSAVIALLDGVFRLRLCGAFASGCLSRFGCGRVGAYLTFGGQGIAVAGVGADSCLNRPPWLLLTGNAGALTVEGDRGPSATAYPCVASASPASFVSNSEGRG